MLSWLVELVMIIVLIEGLVLGGVIGYATFDFIKWLITYKD